MEELDIIRQFNFPKEDDMIVISLSLTYMEQRMLNDINFEYDTISVDFQRKIIEEIDGSNSYDIRIWVYIYRGNLEIIDKMYHSFYKKMGYAKIKKNLKEEIDFYKNLK